MRLLLIPGLVAALSAAAPCVRPFCDCFPPPFPLPARDAAAAVFVGEVVSVRDSVLSFGKDWGALARIVRFSVRASWKGVEADTVTVATTSSCGYEFEAGKPYLVYATRRGERRPLETSICHRTAPEDRAADDLRALGEPIRRRPETAGGARQ